MIKDVENEVYNLLCNDKTGHSISHIKRVLNLSLKFSNSEGGDNYIVSLISLLHDVDDYKLFGEDSSNNLYNAKSIMNKCNIDSNIQEVVLKAIREIGYSKRLDGIIPSFIESKIVSDSDMCDAIGANGILRVYDYSIYKGRLFFNKDEIIKDNIDSKEYKNINDSGVGHMFQKILKLRYLMLTDSGKKEAEKRSRIVIDFLYNLFDEEEEEKWKLYLDNYIKDQEKKYIKK